MRIRSYEYYEVVTDLTGKTHNVLCRGSKESCKRQMDALASIVDANGNLYLVRCQLVEAFKADKS